MEQNRKYGEAEYLTDQQLDLLIKHLPEGPHRVAVCVMRWSASRISETLMLRWSDITENKITYRKTNTKTKKTRKVPLHPKLKLVLTEWEQVWYMYPLKARKLASQSKENKYQVKQPEPTDYVFKGRIKGRHLNRKSVDRVLRRTLNDLEIRGASCHSMRRSMLTKLKDIGFLETDIMEISGHSDLNSLKKYLKTTDTKKNEMINALN